MVTVCKTEECGLGAKRGQISNIPTGNFWESVALNFFLLPGHQHRAHANSAHASHATTLGTRTACHDLDQVAEDADAEEAEGAVDEVESAAEEVEAMIVTDRRAGMTLRK